MNILANLTVGGTISGTDYPGKVYAFNYVATTESGVPVAPTAAGDLATTQWLTFTMGTAGNVIIEARADTASTAAASNRLWFDIDGTLSLAGAVAFNSATNNSTVAGLMTASLSAGSHTIKLKFDCTVAGASFVRRCIVVRRAD